MTDATWHRGVTYLLGAGASVDAGLPVASELTSRVVAHLNEDDARRRDGAAALLNYVVSAMVLHRGRTGDRPDFLPDIESVVSAVELLAERSAVELAPFIQSWDPSVDALDRRSRSPMNRWATDLHKAIRQESAFFATDQIVRALETFLAERVNLPGSGHAYSELRDELVRLLVPLLQVDEASTDYLTPLVQLGSNAPVTVATLNYDLTVETAARRAGVKCTTGIDNWSVDGSLSWGMEGIRLLKLHGSIDWVRHKHESTPGELSLAHEVIGGPDEERWNAQPFVIYGRREKLRPEGPFLELRGEMTTAMRNARYLVVIGYSFSDRHVNEVIRKWLVVEPRRVLVVVDPRFPDLRRSWDAGNPFTKELMRGLWNLDPRDPGRTLQSRLLVLREPASAALPSVCAGVDALDELLEQSLSEPITDAELEQRT